MDISGASSPLKNSALSVAEESVGALLTDNGQGWRDSRVEFQRRIAFPAACLVFALLGVPMGVRPRRGGRAGGLILTLVLVGGYYFLFVIGRSSGRAGPNFAFYRRVGRQHRRDHHRFDHAGARRKYSAAESGSGLVRIALEAHAPTGAGGRVQRFCRRAAARRRASPGVWPRAGPWPSPCSSTFICSSNSSITFFVLLAAFVLIFDAFTLFDLLGDIARNHVTTH